MPTLVVRHPDGTSTEHELSGSLSIGRADGNDLVLAQGGVSRKHATVSAQGGAVYVEDHGSANGTFVDGERIEGKTKLAPRGQIVIGDYELSIKAGAAPAKKAGSGSKPLVRGPGGQEPTAARPSAQPAKATKMLASQKPVAGPGALARRASSAPARSAPGGGGGGGGASLKGLTGPWANKLYPIRGKVVVGRVAGVQVLVEDDSVSRRHAELEKTANGVVVRDLGSANGTLLNGSPLAPNEEVVLATGDVVQFGVIEMEFDSGDAEVLNAPTRRGGSSGGRQAMAGGGASAPAPGGKKKLLVVVGGLVGVLLVGGVALKVLGGPEQADPVQPDGPQVGAVDPQEEINQKVSECRTYSATDIAGQEPDWERAERACNFVLEQEPIHPEATSLMRRIKVEKEAFGYYRAAEKLQRVQRDEEALVEFAKIAEESAYFRKVRAKVKETVESVKKRTGDDCRSQVKNRFFSSALPRCEKYMQVACCEMDPSELSPPPGYKIVLDGKLPRDGWRPKDPVHVAYLRAKKEAAPDSPPFECPNTRIFCAVEQKAADPKTEVEAYIKTRYTEKPIQEALMSYWAGRDNEAMTMLFKLRENREKAAIWPLVDQLKVDISAVAQLFKRGESLIQAEKVMDADEPFREALAIDSRLMQEMTDKRPSFFRKNISADMAAAAYGEGKKWADRQDPKKGCRAWKLGYQYSKADPELLRAIGFCSNTAATMVKGAESCEQLDEALHLAVDGDGNKAKIELAKGELQCPASNR